MENVSVTHTHRIDILVGLAIKFKVKFWSIFTQEVSIPIDLTDFVPELRAQLSGLYYNKLSARGGNTAAALPEVIWG